jgi:hypothetical protein
MPAGKRSEPLDDSRFDLSAESVRCELHAGQARNGDSGVGSDRRRPLRILADSRRVQPKARSPEVPLARKALTDATFRDTGDDGASEDGAYSAVPEMLQGFDFRIAANSAVRLRPFVSSRPSRPGPLR